jgi:glycosyltransferase involved in cell wall biosynthesis
MIGNYRVLLPAKAVTEKRLETGVHIEATDSLGVDAIRAPDGVIEIHKVFVPGGVNVVSFQRPWRPGVAAVIRWLRAQRPDLAIVTDLDDEVPPLPTDEHLKCSIALSDVFIASNQATADKYGYDPRRTFVIRTGVPTTMLDNPARALSRKRAQSDLNKDRIVGYSGGNLEAMTGALASIIGADRTGGRHVIFRAIGPRNGVAEALGVSERDVEASGVLRHPDLYRVALGELDVAIVPSGDNVTRALEFAAAGVPVVALRTPEHEALVNQGLPLWLVKRKREWTKAVRSMLAFDDRELRDLAASHRANIRQHHTMDRRAFEWARAYREAFRVNKES